MGVAIRVYNGLFGPNLTLGALRMGDLIAVCNFLEHIRNIAMLPDLKMYLPDDTIFPSSHCIQMRDWLEQNTDYITTSPDILIELPVVGGTDPTYNYFYNIWNIRRDVTIRRQYVFDIPDKVYISNKYEPKSKIVLCPLMDAPYNAYRNWPFALTQHLVDTYSEEPFAEHVLIAKAPIPGLDLKRFVPSYSFHDNLVHVMEATSFIGGETGFTKFASVLDPSIKFLTYFYSKETYGTTYPFSWKTKGRIIHYDGTDYTYPGKED